MDAGGERTITSLKIDVIFKRFFTDKNNVDLLKHFLSALLSIDYDSITDIRVENPEMVPDASDGKTTRFDIHLFTGDKYIIIEMQMVNVGYFEDRTLYYWARKFSSQLKKGDAYGKLKPTVSINIMDFSLFDTEDYHSMYTVADMKHGNVLSDKCAIHYFELSKIDKDIDANNKAKLWLQLIKAESEGDLDMLERAAIPEIANGIQEIKRYSSDTAMRIMAEEREKAIRDYISSQIYYREKGLSEGRAQGLEEGRAKGLQEGRAKGLQEGRAKGLMEGRAKGLQEGRAEGRAEGRNEVLEALAKRYREKGMSESEIAELLSFGE